MAGLAEQLLQMGMSETQHRRLIELAQEKFGIYAAALAASSSLKRSQRFFSIKKNGLLPNLHLFCAENALYLYSELSCESCAKAKCRCITSRGGSKLCQPALCIHLSPLADPQIKRVAKLILQHKSEGGLDRFESEIDLMHKFIGSPFIAQILHSNVSESAGVAYYEYCNQGSLTRFFKMNPHFTLETQAPFFLCLFRNFLGGLAALEEKAVVHRDIKEDNLLIHQLDSSFRGVIADFDTALEHSVVDDCAVEGITDYYSPGKLHKYLGNPTVAADLKEDVWAMGCLFHWMLYRKMPRWCPFVTILTSLYNDISNLKAPSEDAEPSEGEEESKGKAESSAYHSDRSSLALAGSEERTKKILDAISAISLESLIYWGAPSPAVDKPLEDLAHALNALLEEDDNLSWQELTHIMEALHVKIRQAWSLMSSSSSRYPLQNTIWEHMLHSEEGKRKTGRELVFIFEAFAKENGLLLVAKSDTSTL